MGVHLSKITNGQKQPECGSDVLLPPATPCDVPPKDTSFVMEDSSSEPKEYTRRWFILGLFVLYSFSNAYQWIHLNIIANIVIKFYNESLPESSFQQETAVDWLSMIYMLSYIPLIFPATWLLDKKGLRVCVICGACLNALGAWLKCVTISPDKFAVLMFAQTICAIAQIFILGIPARLAAVWFGPDQVSTATSIGVFGNQVGVAVGFLLPPILVPNSDDLTEIGRNLGTMYYIDAGLTTTILIIIIFVFKAGPPRPPSKAQMLAGQCVEENYMKSLLRLFKNRGFIILMISYGINTGCYYGIGTLLNPIILHYFPDHETSAGQIGLSLVLAGVAGSIVAGLWLDRTKTFKSTTVGIYFLSMAGMVVLTFTMDVGLIWIVFLTGSTLGLGECACVFSYARCIRFRPERLPFFMTGYLPVGFEFAAEITYPESEGTSSGLLNASAQTFGIIMTIGMRALMNKVSVLAANITVSVALFIGIIMTAFIKADYRRQAAGRETLHYLDNVKLEVHAKDPDISTPTETRHKIPEQQHSSLKTTQSIPSPSLRTTSMNSTTELHIT